jgi:hypothetical protein
MANTLAHTCQIDALPAMWFDCSYRGRLVYRYEFTRSWPASQATSTIDDCLQAQVNQLGKYADAEMRDVRAYRQTLRQCRDSRMDPSSEEVNHAGYRVRLRSPQRPICALAAPPGKPAPTQECPALSSPNPQGRFSRHARLSGRHADAP